MAYMIIKPTRFLKFCVLGGALMALSVANMGAVYADEAADNKGYAIAKANSTSNDGFGDSVTEVTMILRNKTGNEVSRQLKMSSLEVNEDGKGDKILVVFLSPKDVKGTTLLSHINIDKSDNQWLFLPKLKRVKRISSRNKSGPFVGSEFAFEDFSSFELEKYRYEYVGEEVLDGLKVDVIKRFPLYKNSGYVKQIAYIDQKDKQTRKVVFYDRKDALLKTLILSDYKKYGNYWRAQKLEMVNHQTGKSTIMQYGDYHFKTGLTPADFERSQLK